MAVKKKTTVAQTKATAAKATEIKAAEEKKSVVSDVKATETKATLKRVSKKVNIELQYAGKCIDIAALESKAVADWVEVTGNAKTSAKSINLYVKPEENKVYYVIEGESGEIEL